MSYLTIPAELLYKDENYESGTNGYPEQQGYGMTMRFDRSVSPPQVNNDGAILGSFTPPDDWDGTLAVSATCIAGAVEDPKAAQFYVQARVCNVDADPIMPEPNDVRHTRLLLIPNNSSAQGPLLTWGPVAAFTPDGPAFQPGALVTFRIAYEAEGANTTNTNAVLIRSVNFEL